MTDSLKGRERYFANNQFPFKESILDSAIHGQLHFVLPTKYMQTHPRTLDCYNKEARISYEASLHISMLFFIVEAIQNSWKYRGENRGKPYIRAGYLPRYKILMSYITKEVFDGQGRPLPAEELLRPENTVAYMFSIFLLDSELRIEDALADQIDINWHGPPQLRKKKDNGEDDEDDRSLPEVQPGVPTDRLDVASGPFKFATASGLYVEAPMGNRKDPKNYHKFIRKPQDYARFLRVCTGATDVQLNPFLDSKGYRLNVIPDTSPLHHTQAFGLSKAVETFEQLGANEVFCHERAWHRSASGDVGARFSPPSASIHNTVLYDLEEFTVSRLLGDKLLHAHVLDQHLLLNTKERLNIVIGEGDNALDVEAMMHSMGFLPPNQAYIKEREELVAKDIFNEAFEKLSKVHRDMLAKRNAGEGYQYAEELLRMRQQGLELYSTQLDLNNARLPAGYRAMLSAYLERLYKVQVPVQHLWQGGEQPMTPFAQYRATDIVVLRKGRTSTSTLMLLPKLRRAADSVCVPASEINTNKENISLVSGPGVGKSVALLRLQMERIKGTFIEKSGGSAQGLVGSPSSERLLEVHQEANAILAPIKEPTGTDLNTLLRKLTQIGEGRDIYETTRKNPDTKEREGIRYESPYTNSIIVAHNARPTPKNSESSVAAMYNRFSREFVQPSTEEDRRKIIDAVFASDQRFDKGQDIVTEQAEMLQMAIMDYWGAVAYQGVPMPDISLFSDLAPRALYYVCTIRREALSQLRDLTRMKVRMYCEIVRHAARMVLTSPIGLNSDAPAVYDRDAVVIEMSKYAYASMDMVVYVVSEALMSTIDGNLHTTLMEIIKRDTNYVPLGSGAEGEELRNLKPFPREVSSEVRRNEPYNMQHQTSDVAASEYSLDRLINYALTTGLNYLSLPECAPSGRASTTEVPTPRVYDLKEVAVDPNHTEIFGLLADKCPVEPLIERNKEVKYKIEYIERQEYINYNYIKVQGSISDYGRMFNSTALSEEMVLDMLYKLRKKVMAVPYIPVMQKGTSAKSVFAWKMHSLRYSKTAINAFKKFKVPVLISDVAQRCFYILAAFVENKPQDLIESAIRQMCFDTTRPINCLLGIPMASNPNVYAPIEIRPTNRKYTRQNSQDLNEAEEELYATVVGTAVVEEVVEDLTNEDLEEYYAKRYLKQNFPNTAHIPSEYTPAGIHKQLHGLNGYYTYNDLLKDKKYPDAFLPKPRLDVIVIENEVMGDSAENLQTLRRKETETEQYQPQSKRSKNYPAENRFGLFDGSAYVRPNMLSLLGGRT